MFLWHVWKRYRAVLLTDMKGRILWKYNLLLIQFCGLQWLCQGHVICKSNMLVWKSWVLVWKQDLTLFIIWSPGRIKILPVWCSSSGYPSGKTIQMQVALPSAQNTQNCFKYTSKLTVNVLYYSIRLNSFQIMWLLRELSKADKFQLQQNKGFALDREFPMNLACLVWHYHSQLSALLPCLRSVPLRWSDETVFTCTSGQRTANELNHCWRWISANVLLNQTLQQKPDSSNVDRIVIL